LNLNTVEQEWGQNSSPMGKNLSLIFVELAGSEL
jgi:hypothetical protein